MLSRLPPEIRIHVWKYMIPNQNAAEAQAPRGPKLALLRASRQIYNEASHHVYKSMTIHFEISPACEPGKWFTVSSNSGLRLHREDLEGSTSQGFDNLPYRKLDSIQVSIEAPSAADPGQILCLWQKCFDLASFLEARSHDGLPRLEIYLKDTAMASWCARDQPQKTLQLKNFEIEEDWELILAAFQRLRQVPEASINVPDNLKQVLSQESRHILCCRKELLTQKEAFGGTIEPDNPWSDDELREEQDRLYLALERELDNQRGKTADMLRLRRFATWYEDESDWSSRAETVIERIFRSGNEQIDEGDAIYVLGRYTAMRALNPRSLVYQHGPSCRWRDVSWYSGGFGERLLDAYEDGVVSDDWEQEAWYRCYPDGISRSLFYKHYESSWLEDPRENVPLRDRQYLWDRLMLWLKESRCEDLELGELAEALDDGCA